MNRMVGKSGTEQGNKKPQNIDYDHVGNWKVPGNKKVRQSGRQKGKKEPENIQYDQVGKQQGAWGQKERVVRDIVGQ